tara:strand:- start:28 stop:426 length:399 start_codon:yes stop_codon:yes gene_type:complete
VATDVLERAIKRAGWTEVSVDNINEFLAPGGKSVLFFAGDSSKRPEADDVAVILPELQKDFNQAFRVGVVHREAFADLKDQFKVHFLPTLCLLNGEEPAGNIVRIQNWGEYHNKFAEFVNDGYPAAGETANV